MGNWLCRNRQQSDDTNITNMSQPDVAENITNNNTVNEEVDNNNIVDEEFDNNNIVEEEVSDNMNRTNTMVTSVLTEKINLQTAPPTGSQQVRAHPTPLFQTKEPVKKIVKERKDVATQTKAPSTQTDEIPLRLISYDRFLNNPKADIKALVFLKHGDRTPQWVRVHPIPTQPPHRCIAVASSTGVQCLNKPIGDLPVCGVHRKRFDKITKRPDSHWAPWGESSNWSQ